LVFQVVTFRSNLSQPFGIW